MQFSRTNGVALIILGLLLILAQAFIIGHFLTAGSQASPAATGPNTSYLTYAFNFVPGLIGLFCLFLGGYFAWQGRNKIREDNPPAKTRSGLPM